MTTEERYRAILANHLPAEAVERVYRYLEQYRVHFHITRERRSKLGDYRWPQRGHEYHEISINGDLQPSMFLWVFLHEAAHLETHLKYSQAQPHGHEWQEEYRQLLTAWAELFPDDVRPLVARYCRRIPLSRSVGRQIEQLLKCNGAEATVLNDLPAGSQFRLKAKPDLLFVSEERRRTRWRCREVNTGREYLVNGTAEIQT